MAQPLNDIVIPGLVTGGLYGLVAVGFNVLERTCRLLNFAHGDLIMWAPLGTLVAYTVWGLPEWASLIIGFVICIAMALAMERIAIRPFVGRPTEYTWILSTLGASVIVEQLAAQPFQSQPQFFPFGASGRLRHYGPFFVSGQQVVIIGAAVACVLLLMAFYRWSRVGHALIAVGEDLDGARALGISASRMSQVAMVIAALTAATTGFVIAPTLLVAPSFGFSLTFTGFVAAAIGGLGSIGGALVGGVAVGLLIQFTGVYIGSVWTDAVVFGSLMVVYFIRPWGLFGKAPVRVV